MTELNPPLKSQRSSAFAAEWDEDTLPSGKRLFLWISVCILGVSGLIFTFLSEPLFYPELKVGDIAYHDLRTRVKGEIEDTFATEQAQLKARNSVVPVFKANKVQYEQFAENIQNELAFIKSLQKKIYSAKSTDSTIADKSAIKTPEYYELYIASAISPTRFDAFSRELSLCAQKVNRALPRFSVQDNTFWQPAVEEFLPDNWSPDLRKQSALLVCRLLTPNLMIDEDATYAKAEQLTAVVKPVMRAVQPGTILLKKGEIVTKNNIKLLDAAGIRGQIRWPLILTLVLSLVASSTFVGIYLYTYKRQFLFSLPTLGLIFTTSIIACSIAFTLSNGFEQLIPLPALALILTIFFGRSLAFIVALPLLVLLTVDGAVGVNNFIALSAGCCAAIFAYSKQRHDLVLTGLLIGVCQSLGFLISLAIAPQALGIAGLGRVIGFEFLGGIVSAIVSIGCLPFLENMFGLLTPFRLSELTNAEQPLLRKLEEKAPGTYQHSLAVANLAEAGARAIGADANLVRAGALYHDLGKAADPKYFIENQLGDKNPHDSISPEESREKVLNHVKDGIDLAIKNSLPKAIRDFIPMHQGTSLMAYFYHKACLRDGADKVDSNFYRYPGPKPNSKETAIVMLADVSEAVTHSMNDPSQEEIDEALAKVFENRWQDGQLNQSTLTYKELQEVKSAFVKVWRDLHHERLKYPTTTTGRMAVPPQSVAPHS